MTTTDPLERRVLVLGCPASNRPRAGESPSALTERALLRLTILAAMADALLERVALAQARPREEAACALAGLWDELDEHPSVARLAIAHALADLQGRPGQQLKWDLRALAIADRLTDAELERAGVHFPVRALYPSLHLNAGDAFRKVGDLDSALAHARLGREALDALGEDPYGGMLTEGLARLEARILRVHAGGPDR